eukprot:764651-Hanusia_phi.AAC.2
MNVVVLAYVSQQVLVAQRIASAHRCLLGTRFLAMNTPSDRHVEMPTRMLSETEMYQTTYLSSSSIDWVNELFLTESLA